MPDTGEHESMATNKSGFTGHPILPQKGKRNILITSALPYVNNVPHLGNIIGAPLSADVSSRYWKGRGNPTLFICGTDEYGTATETKALEEKVTPRVLCDKYNAIHKQVYDWIGIEFDHFGRTSTKQQTEIVQSIFLRLKENNFIEERTDEQPYCEDPGHKRFLADRFVEGECPECHGKNGRGDQCDDCGKLLNPKELINPRCKLDGKTPVLRQTKHNYLRLNDLAPEIEKWVEESKTRGSWSSNGIAITEDWIKKGLQPRGITRDLEWGVPVPLEGFEDKVFYVWFDACIGYVSITAEYTSEWEKWWRDPENVDLFQFMGKDNVPFHTVVFPGSLIGTRDPWTKLHHLSTTEYLNYEKGKFSKSRGIGVFGTNAKDTGVAPDVWRYYLLANRPETGDTEFEWIEFIRALNGVLVAVFGNFVNRVLKFASNDKFYGGIVPSYDYSTYSKVDGHGANLVKEKIAEVNTFLDRYHEQLQATSLRAGLQSVIAIARAGNGWLQSNTLDGKLFSEDRETCDAVLGLALNLVDLLAAISRPYLPATSHSMIEQLGLAEAVGTPLIPDVWNTEAIKPGHKLGTPQLLFTQIQKDEEQAEKWKEQFGGSEAKKAKEEKEAKKKADKERKKAKKAASKNSEKTLESDETKHNTVETAEKIGAMNIDEENQTMVRPS